MFWVTMAGILPLLYSEASARWPRPGRAAAKVGSIAKRRRHASSRASWLATNSSNGIGRLRVHNPPGERKSGIPHSVEIPAPVKGRMAAASAIMSPSCSTPLRRSGAITGIIRMFGRALYSTASRIAKYAPASPASPNIRPPSGRVRNRLLVARLVVLSLVVLGRVVLLVALLWLCRRSGSIFLTSVDAFDAPDSRARNFD